MFIGGQQSYIWVEIVLGNDSEQELMITELDIRTNSDVENLDIGESDDVTTPDLRANSPYYETDKTQVESDPDSGDQWDSMYKNSDILDKTEPYFNKGTISNSDKVFAYTVDSPSVSQRVVAVPVVCDTEPVESEESESNFTCKNFCTVTGNGEPILLPKGDISDMITDSSSKHDEHVDTITFWVRFSTEETPTYNGDGEFIFDFQTGSEFSPIRHTYHFYTMPKGGTFDSSRTSPEVEYWSPMDDRTMFDQWEKEYGVEEATQTGTGGDRQMIRVKNGVRDEKMVATSGDYEIRTVRRIDDSVQDFLNVVIAILGTLLIGTIIDGNALFNFAVTTGAVLLIVFVIVLSSNLFARDRLTIFLWQLVHAD